MSRTGSLYVPGHSWFHRMDGAVKLVLFVVWTVLAFMFMDLRVFVVMLAAGAVMLIYSGVPFRKMAFLFGLIVLFSIINGLFILLITPTFGTRLTGTDTPVIPIGYAVINQETLFYVLTLSAKYLTLLPMTLLCLFTTMPSAFAASLNRVGVPYKVAYAVSIALRYIPDLIAEFRSTLHSMEARGMGISKEDGSIAKRLSNLSAVVVPVLQSALHRIDSVTNAMELRGFGAGKKRTWYSGGDMTAADWVVIGLALSVLGFGIWLRSRGLNAFWYPFE
ncbi:energy-coupling factor transporter transmembrane protein EcfT [Paenibacillus sp. N3/727]|uniref:energy-coupling factor transporter transmembrane component T family protein n=1 Tax=Paenibacillus sp. N3/727 TaxID=2925845 RepID=UPI001F536AD2|nr:energy-coupling factor transporter transmembrane component T [Paenibacillus sp. N3/727]UNK18126.1 energy-coupling factor transporter transmembrane protein EcfT [Paenibacillus sp. N3/727]